MPNDVDDVIETTDTTPDTSLREDLASSVAELSSAEETPVEPESAEPAESEQSEPAEKPVRADGRDEKGRFAPKDKAAGPAGAVEPAAGEPPAGASAETSAGTPPSTETPAPTERAPQSWKPLEREAWAQVPAAAREAVLRREAEVARTLQETAQARKGYSDLMEAIRPYEAMVRAEAWDPVRAVSGLLQTAHLLRTSPPAHKAQIIANLMKGYGVPVEALADVLDGAPVQAQAQAAPPYDPRVDQLFNQLQQAEQRRQQMALENARLSAEEFAAEHEFFGDLREDMADVLELAAKRGQKMTMKEAYDRALGLRPDVQQVVKQREAAKAAAASQAQAQKARAASSSVRSSPAVAPGARRAETTSLREDLEASMRELSGR